jgi:predicted LPLAT superfamily acyltransferase
MMPRASWREQGERGSRCMLRLMSWIALKFGRRLGRAVLFLISGYFLLFAWRARRASHDYLQRVLGPHPGMAAQFRHIMSFASTILDRVYLLNDRFDLFEIEVVGESLLQAVLEQQRGAFLLGGHLGSFEIIRALGRRQPGLRIAMVMHSANAQNINKTLAAINPAAVPEIIELGRVDAMLQVRERLDSGMVIGMLTDRGMGQEPSLSLPFLGGMADFPTGPIRLAAMLRRPVLFMCGTYLGGNRYRIHFEPLADFTSGASASQQTEALQNYVAMLERHCRATPYNWFNFFDFWPRSQAEAATPSEPS